MPGPDVMVDIESLSTASDACILSIGAVRFDIDSNTVSEEDSFYRAIDIDSNLRIGRHIEGRTLVWWMDQTREAQDAVFRTPTVALKDALTAFTVYLQELPFERIWCRGAAFDFPALESAFRAFQCAPPWPYYAVRCQRTLSDIASIDKREREDVPHNALDDAVHQALSAQEQWAAIKARAAGTLVA